MVIKKTLIGEKTLIVEKTNYCQPIWVVLEAASVHGKQACLPARWSCVRILIDAWMFFAARVPRANPPKMTISRGVARGRLRGTYVFERQIGRDSGEAKSRMKIVKLINIIYK